MIDTIVKLDPSSWRWPLLKTYVKGALQPLETFECTQWPYQIVIELLKERGVLFVIKSEIQLLIASADDQTIVVACNGECHASISSIGSFQDINEH